MSKTTNRELIQRLREHGETAVPWQLDWHTRHELDKSLADRIESEQKASFHLWWNTWIAPKITEIERRLVKDRKKGGSDGG